MLSETRMARRIRDCSEKADGTRHFESERTKQQRRRKYALCRPVELEPVARHEALVYAIGQKSADVDKFLDWRRMAVVPACQKPCVPTRLNERRTVDEKSWKKDGGYRPRLLASLSDGDRLCGVFDARKKGGIRREPLQVS